MTENAAAGGAEPEGRPRPWYGVLGAAAITGIAVLWAFTILRQPRDLRADFEVIVVAWTIMLGLMAVLTYCMAKVYRRSDRFRSKGWPDFVGAWILMPMIASAIAAINLLTLALLHSDRAFARADLGFQPVAGPMLFTAYIQRGAPRWALVMLLLSTAVVSPHLVALGALEPSHARLVGVAVAIGASLAWLLGEALTLSRSRRAEAGAVPVR